MDRRGLRPLRTAIPAKQKVQVPSPRIKSADTANWPWQDTLSQELRQKVGPERVGNIMEDTSVPWSTVPKAPTNTLQAAMREVKVPKDALKQTEKEVPKDALKRTEKEVPKDALKRTEKEVPKDALKGTKKEVPKDALKGTKKEVPKDALKGTKKEVPKDALKGTKKDVLKGVKKEVQEPDDSSKKMEVCGSTTRIRWDEKDKRFMFSILVGGQKLSFQTTCKAAGMQKDAAEHICRLCYQKFMCGANKEKVIAYRQSLYELLKSGEALPQLEGPKVAAIPQEHHEHHDHEECSGLGARSFWTFACEAMRGASSQNFLCRSFKLEPKITKQRAKLRSSVVARAFNGAQRVLGRQRCDGWEVVRIVACTQNWAKATVASLDPLLLPYGHLNLAQVAQLLANFEAVVALKAKFGLSPVPVEAFPKDWRRRETKESARENAELPKPSKRKIGNTSLERVEDPEIDRPRKTAKMKPEAKESEEVEEMTKEVKAGKKPEKLKVEKKQKSTLEEKERKNSKAATKKVKEEAKKKAKPSPKKKDEAKPSTKKVGDGEKSSAAGTRAKSTKTSKAASVKTADAAVAKVEVEKQIEDDTVCSVCGGPSKHPPMSCDECTIELSKRLGLRFVVGDVVWCSGLGPRWPATVKAIGFDGTEDSKPYAVSFHGETSSSWVSEAQLDPWASRQPPSVSSRWRRRLKIALQDVEKCLGGQKAT